MTKPDTINLRVALPATPATGYEIVIGAGLLDDAAHHIAPLLQRKRIAIIADQALAETHLPRLQNALQADGIAIDCITLNGGEATKTLAQFGEIIDWLLDIKIERKDVVVALGGGVIGDVVGFATATLRRGTRFIQIPTTLLAQVDSSVGGKTGINTRHGKNLIGAFHQPDLVLADTTVLETLPDREMRAGYAEIVKYGALGDRGFFEWLEANGARVLSRDADALAEAVRVSCQAKADIVARDEREQGERALLNLGHSFGHALEAVTGFSDTLLHGEAVAAGMVMAARFSVKHAGCPPDDADRLRAHLDSVGLPTELHHIKNGAFKIDALLTAMQQDKKIEAGALRLILLKALGAAYIAENVSLDALAEFLRSMGAE